MVITLNCKNESWLVVRSVRVTRDPELDSGSRKQERAGLPQKVARDLAFEHAYQSALAARTR